MFIIDAIRCGAGILNEVCVRINGTTHSRWRAVDHEGEVVEVFCHDTAGSQGCA